MNLCLSSDVLPDASLAALDRACVRRALTGLALTLGAGHGHGLDARVCPMKENAGLAGAPRPTTPVTWLRLSTLPSAGMLRTWARAAYHLGAGLLLPTPVDAPLAVRTALVHRTDPDAARRAADWATRHGAQTAWAVTPARHTPDALRRTLDATAGTLAHVRLIGGGPEAETSDDAGTGALMAALALRGYGGTVSLAPSPGADLDGWRRWLLDERGWGCNTAAEKRASSSTTHT